MPSPKLDGPIVRFHGCWPTLRNYFLARMNELTNSPAKQAIIDAPTTRQLLPKAT